MRRRPQGPAVALFPFLAVLLCAMGALILLLLILTRQIRENALRVVREEPAPAAASARPATIPRVVVTIAPPAVTVADPNAALSVRLAEEHQQLATSTRSVDDLRNVVATRRDALESLEAKLAEMQFGADAARQRLAARNEEVEQRTQEHVRLIEEVARAEGTLASVRQRAEAAEARLTIVPYDGRYGTARRPILIECTREAIRFLSEDVSLSAADLAGFPRSGNPLLAGVMALREHWERIDGPRAAKPYVLLLVRPDGIAAYYAARNFLEPVGGDTGYELLSESFPLAMPEADATAAAACRAAVLKALQHRSSLLADTAMRARREPLLNAGRFEADPPLSVPQPSFAPGSGSTMFDNSFPPEAPLGAPPPGVAGGGMVSSPAPAGNGNVASDMPSRLPGDSAPRPLTGSGGHSVAKSPSGLLPDLPGLDDPGRRGRWGLAAPSASISLERPVTIVVTAESVSIGSQPAIPIGPQGVTAETGRAVLEAIEAEARTWGRAPGQFYWSPRLYATLRPGGAGHFDRLKRSIGAAGLRTSDRIVLEPTAPAFLELSHAKAEP